MICRPIDTRDHPRGLGDPVANSGSYVERTGLPQNNLAHILVATHQLTPREADGRNPEPIKALERIVRQKVSKRKIGLNCLLKRNKVNVFFGHVLAELRATPPVPASADIPEEITH